MYFSSFRSGVPIDERWTDIFPDEFAGIWQTTIVEPCDVNADGFCDVDDIDALVGETTDLESWLSSAAEHNGFSEAYLAGDSNLDGSVNSIDLNNLALNWRQSVAEWSGGDFTANGVVDSLDLNALALNWQKSIAMARMPWQ